MTRDSLVQDVVEDFWEDRRVKIGYETAEELAHKFNELNWRGHPDEQAESLDESLDTLHWIGSVKVNIQTQKIFDGHLRVKRALLKNPQMRVPVDYYDLTPDEELLALQVHDAITEQAQPIPEKLNALLERTRALTADKPGLAGMLEQLRARAGVNGNEGNENGQKPSDFVSLSDRFIVPPFSVLDARQGYWQKRKTAWLALGIQSELGRGENLQELSSSNDTDRYSKKEFLSHKPNATPGGSPLPAASLKDGKTVRGDGRGRPIIERE